MIRNIEEYVKAKKRLSTELFTILDIVNILNTEIGFFIVNNVKIPIKNGALDLTQWISKEKHIRAKQTLKEKKEAHKKAQIKYRRKLKSEKELGITEKPNKEKDNLFVSFPQLFRDFNPKKSLISKPKRLITAIRLIKPIKRKEPIKSCANIPIQHLLKTANWLRELAKDKGEKTNPKEFKDWLIKTNRINKHYKPRILYLRDIEGTLYKYTDKGLIRV